MEIKFLKNVNIINSKSNNSNKRLTYNVQMKKNKIKKIIIRDGLVKILFDLNDLYCSFCKCNDCYHIMFIYYEYFKIKFNLVPLIFCNKFQYDFKDYKEETFNDYCVSYLNSSECCYCLDELGSKDDLWKCNNCHNLIHNKCIKEWIKQKNECPLCKQEIIKNSIF